MTRLRRYSGATGRYVSRTRRYWIAAVVAFVTIVLIAENLNPAAKHTTSLYLSGKTMAAGISWYLLVKVFCPYSDLADDMARGDLPRIIGSVGIRIAAALIVMGVWSTV